MSYRETVNRLANDPEQLEQVYQAAKNAGDFSAFKEAIDAGHAAVPDNLLYAAWFHRLKQTAEQGKSFVIAWAWVIPLAVANGLLFWWLSDDERFMVEIAGVREAFAVEFLPAVFLWAAPISAAMLLIYFTAVSRQRWLLGAAIGVGLLAAGAYVLQFYPQAGTRPFQEQYLSLMALHLPLLAWAGVGLFLIAGSWDPINRFAFLIKSLEVFIMGGLFAIAGGLFTGITVGLFAALNIDFSTLVQRLFIAGGAGLIPVVATAVIFNPNAAPAGQAFDEGLSKLIALLMRILLPLTLLVLLVYLGFIPFNFFEPFNNREVLITYNVMLFAVIALLVGATPVTLAGMTPRLSHWLRVGILAVASLALIVSVYALAAIVYRTALDRLTPNRLAFIGWNVINIGLLILVLYNQARTKSNGWLQAAYRAYTLGTVAYAAWSVVIVLAVPWLFGINQGKIDNLPASVQEIIYEKPGPILLKCNESPHIYLLDRGQKRWIDSIETFTDRGYVWNDVRFISCDDLRSVPDGVSIPQDAGPPPQP